MKSEFEWVGLLILAVCHWKMCFIFAATGEHFKATCSITIAKLHNWKGSTQSFRILNNRPWQWKRFTPSNQSLIGNKKWRFAQPKQEHIYHGYDFFTSHCFVGTYEAGIVHFSDSWNRLHMMPGADSWKNIIGKGGSGTAVLLLKT